MIIGQESLKEMILNKATTGLQKKSPRRSLAGGMEILSFIRRNMTEHHLRMAIQTASGHLENNGKMHLSQDRDFLKSTKE